MNDDNRTCHTLGDKLTVEKTAQKKWKVLPAVLLISLGVIIWAAATSQQIDSETLFYLITGAISLTTVLLIFVQSYEAIRSRKHFLLSHDQQGFVAGLRLKDKTAIFDGSNIYHFGLDNRLGTGVLRMIVHELRNEGYRVVCFFDANIFYTLRDHNDLPNRNARFSLTILRQLFALNPQEIYVVPSGQQADKYVLETLTHLPMSFAVTNDRFRDYENQYDVLTEPDWRKGVQFKAGELYLHKHKFRNRIRLKDAP